MDPIARITLYDFNDLLYSSFYLSGFAQCAPSIDFRVSHVTPPLPGISAGTAWKHILLFHCELPGENFYFCIDTRDSARAGDEHGRGYDLGLLEKVKFYGKVNYRAAAIAEDPRLAPFAGTILPVLPFFPVRAWQLPRYMPEGTMGWTSEDTLRRFKQLREIPALEDMVAMRALDEDIDIFFVVTFSGKPEHTAEDEYRYRVLRAIQENRDVRSVVGFVGKAKMPEKFSSLRVKRYDLKGYLSRVARSRVAIYVRGLHDCISFKFGQLLALGKPVAGQVILNNVENVGGFEGFDEQFGLEEPEEIAERAFALLGDPERRTRLAQTNAATFDSRFTPVAVVSEILRDIGVAVDR